MTVTSPFGSSIRADDIIDALGFFDTWEERYKYIIDLGKELPPMAPEKKDGQHLVRGCQSQVWIDVARDSDRWWFFADSDAFIVKGLLGVVLAAYNGKTTNEVRSFDIETYFSRLGLLNHLSPTRGNGLRAMVKRIQQMVDQAPSVS